MTDLLSFKNLADLGVLIFLQAVLGFDNLLYISLESQRAPAEKQAMVRRYSILLAIVLRIVLLFVIVKLVAILQAPFFHLRWSGVVEGAFTFSTIVFLLGGGFIMYTAVKEISRLMVFEDLEQGSQEEPASVVKVGAMIVIMNLVFSFDSILSALAISKVFWVLATAIAVSGVAMVLLADKVSEFLHKHRKYEVLGLFILLIVGVVLLGEGGHVAHLKLFGYQVDPMSKTTFYFSISVLVLVDILQSRYKRRLDLERARKVAEVKASLE